MAPIVLVVSTHSVAADRASPPPWRTHQSSRPHYFVHECAGRCRLRRATTCTTVFLLSSAPVRLHQYDCIRTRTDRLTTGHHPPCDETSTALQALCNCNYPMRQMSPVLKAKCSMRQPQSTQSTDDEVAQYSSPMVSPTR